MAKPLGLTNLLRIRMAQYLAAATLLSTASGAAFAQAEPEPLQPRLNIDQNGVDLATGSLIVPGPSISIGQPGAGGLSFALVYAGSGWRSNVTGTISSNGSTYFVSRAGESDTFTSGFVSKKGNGSKLTYVAGTPSTYTYTTRDGVVATLYDTGKGLAWPAANEGYLVKETYPTGEVVDYTWIYTSFCKHDEPEIPGCEILSEGYRLQSVTNNFGYMLHFDYVNNTTPTTTNEMIAWKAISKVTALNRAVDDCAPLAITCTFTRTWPSLIGVGLMQTAVTDQSNRTYNFTYTSGKLTGIKLPGSASNNITIAYDTDGRVQSVNRGFGTWTYAYVDADLSDPADQVDDERTTTVTDPANNTRVVKSDLATSLIKSDEDELDRIVTYEYDSFGRPTKIIAPEGNFTQFTYDSRGNITDQKRVAKSGSGLADIVTAAAYPASCSNIVTCNKPMSTTDARGKVTNYTYDSTHGGALTVTEPDPDAAGPLARPQTRYAYAQKQARYLNGAGTFVNGAAIWRITEVSQCATGSSCAGAANETKTTIAYPSSSTTNNLSPLSVTLAAGDGSVSVATAFTFDDLGNLDTADGPLSGTTDTAKFYYDAARQLTGLVGPDPDGAGALKRRAVEVTFNSWDQPTIVRRGTVNDQSANAFSSFVSLEKAELVYDAFGRVIETRVYDTNGTTKLAVSQTSYDALGRTECVALRMNQSVFGSLPASACTLSTPNGANDRISKTVYDAIGRVTRAIEALSTSLEQDAVTTTYTLNGLVETVDDARGSTTRYHYDGHDQLARVRYPDPTTGSASATDDELFTYDYGTGFGGLLVSATMRDGQVFAYVYDALSRMTSVDAPGTDPDISYSYDNLGRLTSASQTGHALTYAYDALGRHLSETSPLGTVSYQYDAAGRRTRVTWPDAFYVQYDYDVTGAMTNVRENGALSGVGVLATYGYDDLGRRASIARGNGATTNLGFDALSRLTSLAHDPAGTGHDQTWTFAFNAASQIALQTATNAAWNWSYGSDFSDAYTVNNLNQYLTAGAASQAHDGRGNMANDGLGRVMGYDAANRLTSVARTVSSVTTNSTLSWDPSGRLHRFAVAGGATTNFLYDGAQAIAEYDNAATPALLRRYVPGAADDETLVWYEGSGTTDRRWLMTDPRGSVIAIANSSGTVTNINKYDEYGAPAAGNVGRFQYTGQMWLEEAGLYHYKARGYHPELGRFLQTDPIGYGDGMNMYAYVGGDPVNRIDPSGLFDEVRVIGHPQNGLSGWAAEAFIQLNGGGGGGGGGSGGWRGYQPRKPKPVDEIVVIGNKADCGYFCFTYDFSMLKFWVSPAYARASYSPDAVLKQSDGEACQTISASDPTATFWSRENIPATLRISWKTDPGLRGSEWRSGRGGVMQVPGAGVRITLTDPRIVGRNRPYDTNRSITPLNDKYNPVVVRLPSGGDLEVGFMAVATTPPGTELEVCASYD